ncbi:hypothetical protein BDK51DRAFT_38853 [Blyttiomyces helicus]|uniref:Uncharacterized protein n=1 Tax=Blyttiomyces helicus TaxID=388810 RepID=A0A4P9VWP4_9FUNG|nr:hypothetical protein BDK51DRAFT_38853 [Blyttiomyces helicus]|eukprot:RKO83103.1 hypothetical protein BDK51DRAFT_38853 [Blyttiomyces helicus]
MTASTEAPVQTKWDTKVAEFHGGQEWAELDNFVEDFSVTTNGLGIPKKALAAAREAKAVA